MEIRAFGSRSTNRAKPYSDLDLVIMGNHALSDLTLAELALDFEESDLPFRVDLLLWTQAPTVCAKKFCMHPNQSSSPRNP